MMRRDVALIVLFDKEKRILLQYRSETAKRLPNYWAFFGGGIEAGETPEEAVKREAGEELEYILEGPKLVFIQEFQGSDTHGRKYVFVEEYNSKKQLILREGKAMGWKTVAETKELKIVDHDREVLEKIKDLI